jgi:S-adenosylmethionine:tRNA ribosyltransferase-isomerase
MTAARESPKSAKLLVMEANGRLRHLPRTQLAELFSAGDLVVANDAATLPASLYGTHISTGATIELRLAAWISVRDLTRFVALVFGKGDHRTLTDDRPLPPPLAPGDLLDLGPLTGVVDRTLGHPRLIELRLCGSREVILAGLARHGRPVQYSHIREPLNLWDVWTRFAADPIAFEPPSAGFAIDWRTLASWRLRGIAFATLTLATGLSATGDADLDRKLPFDEPYRITKQTAARIASVQRTGGRIIAVGTSGVCSRPIRIGRRR